MLEKLLSHLKFIKDKDRIIKDKDKEIMSLKEKLLVFELKDKPLSFISVDEEDPESSLKVDRKSYIAKVAAFHADIFNKKIKRMIADNREYMMAVNRETFGYSNQEFDIYQKGIENILWKIHEFGENAVSEKMSYEIGEDELEESEVEELKSKINKK